MKSAEAAPVNASLAAAAAMIATPEKSAELLQALQVSLESMPETGPRGRLVRRQIEQVQLACERHLIETERKRVHQAIERDRAAAQEAVARAHTEQARASADLTRGRDRLKTLQDRVAPLERERDQALADSQARVDAAQRAFDDAIANGDKDSEAKAAEALFAAKKALDGTDATMGSLSLRIEARRAEQRAAELSLQNAERHVVDAAETCRQAQALLLLVEYDQQAQALLDSFIAHRVAMNACEKKGAFSGRGVEAPTVQVGSTERVVLGLQMSDYNVRRVPEYNLTRLIKALTHEPDLDVLSQDPWSLPEAAASGEPLPEHEPEAIDGAA